MHEAGEVVRQKHSHMGVALACARWPVAERPNVFTISTATVACLHLLHPTSSVSEDGWMLLSWLCFCYINVIFSQIVSYRHVKERDMNTVEAQELEMLLHVSSKNCLRQKTQRWVDESVRICSGWLVLRAEDLDQQNRRNEWSAGLAGRKPWVATRAVMLYLCLCSLPLTPTQPEHGASPLSLSAYKPESGVRA